MRRSFPAFSFLSCCLALAVCSTLKAADSPQWGAGWSRNLASSETGLPDSFEPGSRNHETGEIELEEDSNVRWVANLGGQTCAPPIIAGGRVYVGTNNDTPRDNRHQEDCGVLICFDEKSGEFLWQLIVPKWYKIKWADWRYIGICSPPSVEGDRVYLVSNRCEVICLDAKGMANGNDGPFRDEGRHMVPEGKKPAEPTRKDADILWVYNIHEELKVEPHNATCSSVLIDGDYIYAATSNGVEWTHKYVVHPEAPSLIVLNKNTGKLVAVDDFGIGGDITHGQWGSPAMGVVDGKKQLYYAAGNGVVYAFEPLQPGRTGEEDDLLKLTNVWKCHGHPLAQTMDRPPFFIPWNGSCENGT